MKKNFVIFSAFLLLIACNKTKETNKQVNKAADVIQITENCYQFQISIVDQNNKPVTDCEAQFAFATSHSIWQYYRETTPGVINFCQNASDIEWDLNIYRNSVQGQLFCKELSGTSLNSNQIYKITLSACN